MKLLIITAITDFKKEVKQILKAANVIAYSYREVIGFRDSTEDAVETNWFATEMNENESILFYAFVSDENVRTIFNGIEEFNKNQKFLSKIQVAVANIEKSN